MTDQPDPKPTVNADPTNVQIATAARDLGLVLAAVTALAGLLSKHDWNGIITFVQSSNAITAAGIIGSAAIPIWRWFAAGRARKLLVQAATSPANTVVNVKD
jgi:hypothetical protein